MIALVSELMSYGLLQSMANGETNTEEEIGLNNMREMIISLVHAVVYVGSIITFIKWFRRAYFNLGQLNKNLSTTDGWVAGAWFIPVYSLFRPYQLMKEMFVETNEILKTRVEGYTSQPIKSIGVWWTFWVLFNLLGNIVSQMGARAVSVEAMQAVSKCTIILGFFAIPLALITVRVIREYSVMEEELNKLYSSDDNHQ